MNIRTSSRFSIKKPSQRSAGIVQHPIAAPSDADLLRHLMEAKGVNQSELHRGTEIPKSTISEILVGKKPFSRAIMRTLAEYLQVGTDILAVNL